MFQLSNKDMVKLEKKLEVSKGHIYKDSAELGHAMGCPNCNGQCRNGCGVTCVSILS